MWCLSLFVFFPLSNLLFVSFFFPCYPSPKDPKTIFFRSKDHVPKPSLSFFFSTIPRTPKRKFRFSLLYAFSFPSRVFFLMFSLTHFLFLFLSNSSLLPSSFSLKTHFTFFFLFLIFFYLLILLKILHPKGFSLSSRKSQPLFPM